ncbi:MAG: phosphoenolpyruvate--protein phosphotransferase [Elusimicrobia bacterium RIFOXYB2_FULL_48_7]|nr:MAG: phosphoenolpyruvate--protein phosphotransferase [Elusimicrobia bacterium RIFOXYB2_FULL_48_7]
MFILEKRKNKLELHGTPITSRVVIGEAYLFKQIDINGLLKNRYSLTDREISYELEKLGHALRKSKMQLEAARLQADNKTGKAAGGIFEAYICIIGDEVFLQKIKNNITEQRAAADYIIAKEIELLANASLASETNEITKNTLLTTLDIYYRLLRDLLNVEQVNHDFLRNTDNPVILVAERLVPSDIVSIKKEKVLGIIIEEGNPTSHVAILLKALKIPAIINVSGAGVLIKTGDVVALSGITGNIIVNPEKEELEDIKYKKSVYDQKNLKTAENKNLPCLTKDNIKIILEANVSTLEDAEDAFLNGAEGVGLVRSEIFYMTLEKIPSVEEEADFYKKLIICGKNKPITIRLLDIGADKNLPYLASIHEDNPELGTRGIRFLLKNTDLLKKQVMSILNASKTGPQPLVKILIPFVTTINDVDEAVKIIEEIAKEMGVNRDTYQIGIMVEIPAAALAINQFIHKVDFVSIGTNDLAQYVFAADRENNELNNYQQIYHPVVLGLIKSVADCARLNKKAVTVCGEIASDPVGASLLVGLGIQSLSMNPSAIPEIREALSGKYYKDLKIFADKALTCQDSSGILTLWNTFSSN